MDGWGQGDKSKSDAIYNANTPFVDSLYKNYPHSHLIASGKNVGLPEGQMGNSEVGHLNIGAGRIVSQDLVKIDNAIKDKSIEYNHTLNKAFKYAKENNKSVHFLGLVSDGGIHSSVKHLMKLCDMTKDAGLDNVYIHTITDGRDTDPQSGLGFIKHLQEHLKTSSGRIASLVGRYYAMDRDKRWDRIKQAYDMFIYGKGKQTTDILKAIKESYNEGITDEFIKPVVMLDKDGSPVGTIKQGDVVICFNFRSDRMRQITSVLSQKDMPDYDMKAISNLFYVTMTIYYEVFKNIHLIFEKENLKNTIGEVISKAGKKQIRIAETEKYAHVTFFFSGGREDKFNGEKRILIPSPKVSTYDLKPSMSAFKVKDAIIRELNKDEADFICLNFANADMVGHTGVYDAIVEAVQTVDKCVKKVSEAAVANNYSVVIIADHGNAEFAINDDGTPNTAHTTNLVPCILIDRDYKNIKNGKLADVAPTILTLMNIDIPKEMTGQKLI